MIINTEKIEKAMTVKKLNKCSLAKGCGIGYATVYDLIEGNIKNPHMETIFKIAEFLGISINELLNGGMDNEKSNTQNKEKEKE